MSLVSLPEGSSFAGRYRVVRCIAAGGMGAVYEVVHLETERRRALKVMLPHLVQSDELRDRFRQEARVAAQIDSAFIVDVFDAGIDEGTQMPFLVMELLRGEELGKRLQRLGRLLPQEVVQYLWYTALALDKTHKANIVHRDLKPENLFLNELDDGPPKIKVLDFGIAKFIAEGGTHANATRSLGTPLYMAPEQFRPGSPVSPATDLYALAMMAYKLLVGATYWEEEKKANSNVFGFAAAVANGPQELATARALRQGVVLPTAFDTWFQQAAAMEPAQRFHSASAQINALASALGLPSPGARAPSPSYLSEGAKDVAIAQTALRRAESFEQGTVLLDNAAKSGSVSNPEFERATDKGGTYLGVSSLVNGIDASKRNRAVVVLVLVGVAAVLCGAAFALLRPSGPLATSATMELATQLLTAPPGSVSVVEASEVEVVPVAAAPVSAQSATSEAPTNAAPAGSPAGGGKTAPAKMRLPAIAPASTKKSGSSDYIRD
ncbi:serine/threonine protein kinase [Polyangium fumosum]|uniref:Serine/threonine protein kinase n=1 Tax=Polyangium fumosum TaxID=889272 RepID=A0A4U1IMH3_9BACT|nr:serine/threonine-protein kinase [Polyangium fumosum]TKC95261.1 serine/threonine protein kinase [Polyangium fumosum]